MSPTERKSVYSLAGIYSLRMMGLFMILPVFALYAENLRGTTPALVGIAIGIYGLTQAALQIPYGMLSDHLGRKKVIAFGLLMFAIGSVVAAMADSIGGVILGRALQGGGAIAAAIMALTADLTREEHRVSAMTTIGVSIGMAFMVSLIAGPLLDQWIGVDGIFWLTAVLSLCGIGVLYLVVPNPVHSSFHRDATSAPQQLGSVLRDPQLLRLDFGVMILHMTLTATFVVLPLALRDVAKLPSKDHWMVYAPVMLVSMAMMVPFVIIAESKRRLKEVFGAAILTLAMAEVVLVLEHNSIAGIVFALFLFFIAFNVLEATLPSLVAKMVSPDRKGTAMGVFSSSQFLGAFMGGMIGGWLHGAFGMEAVFGLAAVMSVIWFLVASTMQSPRYLSSYMVRVGDVDERSAKRLSAELTGITGVAEAVIIIEDGIAYLKVDLKALDREALQQYSVA
ncbi:MAG: MFS transporter [Gammaproteobacteria bacterium]